MEIVFIRHGEPTYEHVGERGYIGHGRALAQLTEAGKRQALLAAQDSRLDDAELIVSSPYTRALQTAAVISRHRDLDIEVELGLHEWIPDLTYQFSTEEFSRRASELCTLNRGECPPECEIRYEPLSALFERANNALKRYLDRGKIIVVAHGVLMIQFARTLKIPYCGISVVEYTESFQWGGWIETAE